MRRHLENLKQKPEHVRHKIAFGVSAGITAAVAVGWLAAHTATGTFVLSSPSRDAADEATANLANQGSQFSELLGAAGAGMAGQKEPELTIVDGNTTSTLTPAPSHQNQTDQTVIPF